jgi:phage terminase small subunit
VEANEELTPAQRLFCLRYAKTFNATASYIRVYGGNANTAGYYGSELLKKPHVRAEIQRLKDLRSHHMLATAEDVVEMYMRIAFADLSDFVEWGRVEAPVMGARGPVKGPDGELLTKQVNEVRLLDSDTVDGSLVQEVRQTKDGASIKMADRMKALEWLAGYFQLNPTAKQRAAFEAQRIALQERSVALQEAKLHGIDDDLDGINLGIHSLADLLNAPVPNRDLRDFED